LISNKNYENKRNTPNLKHENSKKPNFRIFAEKLTSLLEDKKTLNLQNTTTRKFCFYLMQGAEKK